MSLTNVKNRLQDDFAAITGVTRAYDDLPNVSPQSPDLPAIIMGQRDPFIVPIVVATGLVQYQYNFDILFLYKSAGTETQEGRDSGIEPFPQRLMEKLCTDLDGAGAWSFINKDDGEATFSRFHNFEYHSNLYYGFRWFLTVYDSIPTTMSAGV